jgi:hypothetical protein
MADPILDSLDPETAEQGWEGTVSVRGSGFDPKSVVFVDGDIPHVEYVDTGLLKVALVQKHTASAGRKDVKVHTGGGGLSNARQFIVTPK